MKGISDVPMNTYDPVLHWSMVMLMMFLNCIMGLNTKSTEFRNAFSQADLKQLVYLQSPAKYSDSSWGENPIIRINKSLYGQAKAPILWYEKLREVLEKR